MIRAMLFDGYGTLFNEGKESVPKIAREIVRDLELEISSEQLFEEWKSRYLALEKEVFSGKAKFRTIRAINLESLAVIFTKFGIHSNPKAFVDRLYDLWGDPKLFQDAIPALNLFKSKYVRGILSNTDNETLLNAINRRGLDIEYVLTSEMVGDYKPNEPIFKKACEDLNLRPTQIVYIGNSPVDIIGAKKMGMNMVWINRNGNKFTNLHYTPDFEIKSLDQLSTLF